MSSSLASHKFRAPTQCIYWTKPEMVRGAMKERFELIVTYEDDDHLRRRLLKCLERGQLYFFEFYEWIDKDGVNDPQYRTYVPVETREQALKLSHLGPIELTQYSPALRSNFPKEAESPVIYWVR